MPFLPAHPAGHGRQSLAPEPASKPARYRPAWHLCSGPIHAYTESARVSRQALAGSAHTASLVLVQATTEAVHRVQLVQAPSCVALQPAPRNCQARHARQSRQSVLPSPVWKVPAAHAWHVDTRLLGLYVPAAHLAHVASVVALQLPPHDSPGRHALHPAHALPPAVLRNLPVSQAVHAGALAIPEYVPGLHWLHALFAVARQADAWNVPGAQAWQSSQPDFCTPVWYLPAAQVVHAYAPLAVVKLPSRHWEQTPFWTPFLQPLDQYQPASHGRHSRQNDAPVPSWNTPAPAAHVSHPVRPRPL
jgi:hypothetical protein